MKVETKESFDNILDTFGGSDGGVRFVKFKVFIEDFDNRASKGDVAAETIVNIMKQFSKLIDIAQR